MVLEPSSVFGRTFLEAVRQSVLRLSDQQQGSSCSDTDDYLLAQQHPRGEVGSSLWLDVSAGLLKKK